MRFTNIFQRWHVNLLTILYCLQPPVSASLYNRTLFANTNIGLTDSRHYPTTHGIKMQHLDFVRLKLQGFVFEVSQYRKNEKTNASAQLRKLMKPHRHLLLDPQYTSSTITVYHPLSIQAAICQQFQHSEKPQDHIATSLFVVNDIGTMVNRERHDRLLHLFFQITASIGMPTITWMPNRIGEFEVGHLFIYSTIAFLNHMIVQY